MRKKIVAVMAAAMMALALPAMALTTMLQTASHRICPATEYKIVTSIDVVPGATNVTLQYAGYRTGTASTLTSGALTQSDANNDGEIKYVIPVWRTINTAGLNGNNRRWTDDVATLDNINQSSCVFVTVP